MKPDEVILRELEDRDDNSVVYIMRKYQLNYEKARELHHRWVANEPPEPTMNEIIDAYLEKMKAKNASLRTCATA